MPTPPRAPPIPRPLSLPLAWLYGLVIARRNRRFDARKGVIEFDRPTISVGNLSVGGTGKTPMVMHVLNVLRAAGHSPAVAMRGYASAGGESDEAGEYARAFPEVPVVAQPNRVEGLIKLFGAERGMKVDAIVLDDGFQHRRVWRDLDIVLVDATRDPFADALLPAGWLREPVASLKRAGAVVITHAECVDESRVRELSTSIAEVSPHALVAVCEHAWTGLSVVESGAERDEPVAWLRGKAVLAACAIGNPDAFISQVAGAAGRQPAGVITLRDHDPFREPVVRRIIEKAREIPAAAVVVTEKDWSKLRHVPADRWPCAVVRPGLEMRFRSGGPGVDALILERVRARPHEPGEVFDGDHEPAPTP